MRLVPHTVYYQGDPDDWKRVLAVEYSDGSRKLPMFEYDGLTNPWWVSDEVDTIEMFTGYSSITESIPNITTIDGYDNVLEPIDATQSLVDYNWQGVNTTSGLSIVIDGVNFIHTPVLGRPDDEDDPVEMYYDYDLSGFTP